MKKTLLIALLILLAGALVLTLLVRRKPHVIAGGLGPLPMPPEIKAEEVALGRLLFFDGRLSGDGTTSCTSCHLPEKTFTDGEPLSAGYPNTLYFRNTPTVANTAFKKWVYWDGRLPGGDLPTVVRDHLTEAHFMQADGRLIIERLRQVPEYESAFKKIYGKEPSYGKILEAVSAYVKSLNSKDVPFDRYLSGEKNALSDAAERGLRLFTGKANCAECHSGPMLTDEGFHKPGVPENPEVFNEPLRHITLRRFFKTLGVEQYGTLREDVGLYAVTKETKDRGFFKTPSLREVGRTAPYMHNGIFKTLEEVVNFYDRTKSLNLSDQEKRDLVEFLNALSGKEWVVESPALPGYQTRDLGKN